MEPSTPGYFQSRDNNGPDNTDRSDQAQSASLRPEVSRQQADMTPGTPQGNLQSRGNKRPGRTDTERTNHTIRTERTQTQSGSLLPELSQYSTTASNTIAKMTENPATAYKMANVISQLDPEGKEQLQELVGDFDNSRKNRRGERPQGQVASSDYHEQNPWHAQQKKPSFGLAEPFPRKGSESGGRNSERVSGYNIDPLLSSTVQCLLHLPS